MTHFLRGASAIALLSAMLAGCATPQYPTSLQDAARPRLDGLKPQYPIEASPAPAPAPAAATPPAADADSPVVTPPPSTPIESHVLPPPGPSAAADEPQALLLRASTEPTPAPTALPATAAVSTAELPPPAATPAATAADTIAPRVVTHDEAVAPAPTPHIVTHDEAVPASAPPAPAPYAPPPPRAAQVAIASPDPIRRSDPHFAAAGRVVDATDIFEDYEVQRGDHLDGLARALNTSRDTLLDANHLKAPYLIHPGQILKTPVAKAYVVQAGDTLREIGRRFSVDPSQLAEINGISAHAFLHAGEQIGLPRSMRDRGPERLGGPAEFAEATPAPAYYAHPGVGPSAPPPADVVSEALPGHSGYSPPPMMQQRPPSSSYAAPQRPIVQDAAPALSDTEIAAAARGRFLWPVKGEIASGFGPKGVGRRNDGVDIRAPEGTSVQSAADGEVVYAGDQVPGFGNLVLVKHADGWVTAYAHLDKVSVAMKQHVAQGDQLGSVGVSGGLTDPQLHFEVRYARTPTDKAKPVDPVLVLPQ